MTNVVKTKKLRTGNQMPVLGLGTWQLKIKASETIQYAINLGYRLIDTSSDYGTQKAIGKAIKKMNPKRQEIYIVTKVEETDNAYERTKSNLKELGLEYVDLMLIHRPPAKGAGEDLWEDLIRAKDDGLTRDIGVSNYSIDKINRLIEVSGIVPTVNQIEWNPFGHNKKMDEYCRDRQIVIQAYSPLTRKKLLDNKVLTNIAKVYDKSPAQIMLRWSIENGFCPIPKANQKKHLKENLDIFNFSLKSADMDTLNKLNIEYSTFVRPLSYLE